MSLVSFSPTYLFCNADHCSLQKFPTIIYTEATLPFLLNLSTHQTLELFRNFIFLKLSDWYLWLTLSLAHLYIFKLYQNSLSLTVYTLKHTPHLVKPLHSKPSILSRCLSVLAAIFPGEPGLAGARMSLFWILLELRLMEVVVTIGVLRHAKLH